MGDSQCSVLCSSNSSQFKLNLESVGFESVWMYDHFHTWPAPEDVIVFEPFVALSALAALTERVHIGHIVICTGFRNPALTAKMISTLDVVSDGRAELGIGAGWKREEWEALISALQRQADAVAVFVSRSAGVGS